jgi:hypothetical protein
MRVLIAMTVAGFGRRWVDAPRRPFKNSLVYQTYVTNFTIHHFSIDNVPIMFYIPFIGRNPLLIDIVNRAQRAEPKSPSPSPAALRTHRRSYGLTRSGFFVADQGPDAGEAEGGDQGFDGIAHPEGCKAIFDGFAETANIG